VLLFEATASTEQVGAILKQSEPAFEKSHRKSRQNPRSGCTIGAI
jgi:hypothetical protein